MTTSADVRSGKTHRDENFPVASRLIQPRHRVPILAFYRFVRAADDVADSPVLGEWEKLKLLDQLEDTLLGRSDAEPDGVALRAALRERALSTRHAQDLLTAFRVDATKHRYRDWEDLIGYCSFSAMPVGRFVLDVHGESRATWHASDALCAALQVINHLQDCAADYRALDRVYLPMEVLEREHETVAALGGASASPGLRRAVAHLARRTSELLRDSAPLACEVQDLRLSLEISAITRLAHALIRMLLRRDPLSQRVHLAKPGFVGLSLLGVLAGLLRRMRHPRAPAARSAQDA
jgi:hydroxysqualene synthase